MERVVVIVNRQYCTMFSRELAFINLLWGFAMVQLLLLFSHGHGNIFEVKVSTTMTFNFRTNFSSSQ